MRVLVYAAGVYALGVGCAEAFAPKPTGSEICSGPNCPLPRTRSVGKLTQPMRMVSTGMDRAAYEDADAVMARANAMMAGRRSMQTTAASLEASYTKPSVENPADEDAAATAARAGAMDYSSVAAAPVKRKSWKAPVGYVPRASPPAQSGDSDPVMSRVNDMLSSTTISKDPAQSGKQWAPPSGYVPRSQRVQSDEYGTPATVVRSGADPLSSAASTKWQPYGGYVPDSKKAVQSDPLSSAPAKKWEPYGGYVPASQNGAQAEQSYETAQTVATESISSSSGADPLSSAPAKKWQPYEGYVPESQRGVQTDPLSSAPAKKWQPYGGYVPESQKGIPTQRVEVTTYVPYQPAETDTTSNAPLTSSSNQYIDSSSSSTDPLSSAPAKKWSPPVGYVPQSRRSGMRPSSSSWSLPTNEAPNPGYIDPLSNAPAKKWVPPSGYVPKRFADGGAEVVRAQLDEITAMGAKAPLASFAAFLLKARLPAVLDQSQADVGLPRKVLRKVRAQIIKAFSLPEKTIKKVRSMAPKLPKKKPAAAGDYLNTLSSAPAKKWKAPTGYVPKKGIGGAVKGVFSGVKNVRIQLPFVKLPTASPSTIAHQSVKVLKVKKVVEIPLAAAASALLRERLPAAMHAASFMGALGRKCSEYASGKLRLPEQATVKPDQIDKLSNAPAKKWEPYNSNGYVPERLKRQGAGYSAAPYAAAQGAYYEAPTQSGVNPDQVDKLSNAPAKKWQPYNSNGYVPKGDRPAAPVAAAAPSYAAPSSSYAAPAASYASPGTDTLSSAPAKKWAPYGGYTPKGDRTVAASASAPTQAAYEPPAHQRASYEAPASANDPLSNAPAKKWQPYGGYTPASRSSPPTPEPAQPAYEPPAAHPVAASVPAAKPWSAPVGYAPKPQMPQAQPDRVSPEEAREVMAPAVKEMEVKVDNLKSSVGRLDGVVADHAQAISGLRSSVEALRTGRYAAGPASAHGAVPAHASAAAALSDSATYEAAAGLVKKNPLEDPAIYTAVYSPEIEAKRQEREAFYKSLGVPDDEAKKMVSRIVAAYATQK